MPTYEYKCDNCGHLFEHFQSMKDEKLTKCPECGKKKLRRLIGTGSGLIFKGSGFYLTDYKNKSSEKSATSTVNSNSEKMNSDTPNDKKNDNPVSDNKNSEKSSDSKSKAEGNSGSASETKSTNTQTKPEKK